jgi:hypothetical protein
MKKLLVVCILLASGNFGHLRIGDGLRFGMSEQSPVGTLRDLDLYFSSQQLLRRSLDEPAAGPQPGKRSLAGGLAAAGPRMIVYADAAMAEVSGRDQSVRLILGPGGTVRGVGGTFTTSGGSIRVREFLREMWRQAAGGEPRFERASAGAGILARPMMVASFSTPDAEGKWIRHEPAEIVQISSRR